MLLLSFLVFYGSAFACSTNNRWKATHNVHHTVPNTIAHDPDIQHLPVLGVSPSYFESVYSTFHKRVLPFDWAARNIFIPIQHYLYWPVMAVARFNLYVQGLIRLCKETELALLGRKYHELAALAGYFTWLSLLVWAVEGTGNRVMFLLVSHAVAGLLHIQITLSHFSMPTNMAEDYGGDFYTRNIASSLDVDCATYMDWFHGGLQYQTIHHCYPRMQRQHGRAVKEQFRKLCNDNGVKYNDWPFWACNAGMCSMASFVVFLFSLCSCWCCYLSLFVSSFFQLFLLSNMDTFLYLLLLLVLA